MFLKGFSSISGRVTEEVQQQSKCVIDATFSCDVLI